MAQDPGEQLSNERLTHANALQLLGEVRDYLQRLPVVPATREYACRIDEFLNSPATATANRRAQEQRRIDETWEAGAYSAAGFPDLVAEIHGTMLLLAGAVLKPIAPQDATIGRASDVFPAMSLQLRKATGAKIHLFPRVR
jgi:hypothetical protein